MHENNDPRREVYLDHVHQVKVDHIKYFDRLLLSAASSVPFFVVSEGHAGDRLQMRSIGFHELYRLHRFAPEFDVAVLRASDHEVVLG